MLRTNNFEGIVKYYNDFLGAETAYQNDMIAFLTYDDEHHRIAIAAVPGTKNKDTKSCGLEHIAFSFDSLSNLLLAYRQRKSKGIEPLWLVNHSPTTSIYYQDPDGNMIETQVDKFGNSADATAFIQSESFAENPIGTDFDPEGFITRLENGVSQSLLNPGFRYGVRSS